MRKTRFQRFVALLLVVMMLFSAFPGVSFANTPAGEGNPASITVSLSAQDDGFVFPRQQLNVEDGLAEAYGYQVSAEDHNQQAVEGPTVFDALVAAHIALYGQDFTAETAEEYLQISNGMLRKAFQQSATASGFLVNGEMPHDGIDTGNGCCTGYMADTARLEEGDNVEFWLYQDSYYMDYYSFFTETAKTVTAAEPFTLELQGFMAINAMSASLTPVASGPIYSEEGAGGLAIVLLDPQTGEVTETLTDKTTDTEGKVTLSFAEPGRYVVSAKGTCADTLMDMGEVPLISPWCLVTVTEQQGGQQLPSLGATLTVLNGSSFTPGDSVTLEESAAGNISGTLPVYTSTEAYNAAGFTLTCTNLAETDSAKLVLNGREYPFAEGVASTGTDMTIAAPGEYTGQIVVDRAGGAVDTYRLELTKPDNQAKLKGSVSGVGFLTGTPDFDGFISGQKEGTLFQVDQDGGVTGETAIGPECTQYQAFVTKDTETVKINKGLQAFKLFPQSSVDKKPALVDFYVNGELYLQGADSPSAMSFAMKVANKQISFVEDTASFTFVVYEEENHNITTEYQFRIDRLDTEAGDLPQLTAVTVENGVFQNGQEFDPTVYQYVIGHGETIESLTFTLEAADTVSLYLGGELAADKLLARGQDGKYSVTASTSEPLKILAASKTEVNGMEVVNQVVYTFQFTKLYDNQGEGTHEPEPPHRTDIDIVDRIIDYCPAPATAYVPDNPEPVESGAYDDRIYSGKTAWNRFICLGGFGGYMTFAFDTPVVNDPNNPYGIDFIVYGNGFGNSEPGNVLVSQDGVTWYTLAGSMHYELTTDWNKSAKLINGSTVQAVQIATDESGTANVSPLLPIYGYMDNYPCSENANAEGDYDVTAVPGNPYDKRVERNSIIGDGFDLTWAVDANGKPVELDGITYIRVQNAVDLTTGFGTTSPEMGTLVRTKANEAATGVTDGLATLTVNGLDILGQTPTETAYDGQVRYYEISLSDASAASLQIVAEGGAEDNITINNEQFTGAAQGNLLLAEDGSRMAKIIVQNGEKQPVSYVIKCTGGGDPDVNADLASVVLTPGDVVGQWEDGGYRFEVANGVESVSLNATALNPAATVLLNGTQIASGVDSEPFSVAVGKNQATITVTSVDGSVTKTYPVEITRAAKDSSGDEDEISVVFTLKGDTKHGENGKHAAETWIKTTAVRVPEGSTVKYLTDMMLYNAGLSVRTTDGGTYIAEINGLAEMDNGPNSGWMYRMNGYIEDVGYADRVLERGDRVEWFYTDDYTKETNYKGNWGSSGSSSVTQTSADGILSFNAGGTVTPADLTDYVGKDVTLTFQPDSGYRVKDVIVDGKSLGSITAYTYQDLKKTSTIQVVFEKIPAQQLSFSDVPSSHWAAEYIYGLAEAGLMQGTAATTFSPEAKITRGEFVAVLARMSGDELPEYTGQFSDVTADAWYSPYVAWAVYTGVTQGVSDSSFAPLENISRQDLAVMLSRYLEIENVQPATTVEAQSFEDGELIASYAQAAVKQMQQLEIINGKENNLFAPTDATTRAEAAKMLYGVFQLLAE